MISSDKIRDALSRPDERGRCFTGLEIAAIGGLVSTVAGIGMNIAGAAQKSEAERQAGEIAYQNALQRNEQAKAEAKRMGDTANAEQAAAQRQAIEERRKARIMAGRAKAVMAASGAGIDNNLIDGILAEGEYAADAALYEGDAKAQSARYDASLRRWEGETGVTQGAYRRDAMNTRASGTLTAGIVGGALEVGSIAAKYGGRAPGGRDDSGPDGGVPFI